MNPEIHYFLHFRSQMANHNLLGQDQEAGNYFDSQISRQAALASLVQRHQSYEPYEKFCQTW